MSFKFRVSSFKPKIFLHAFTACFLLPIACCFFSSCGSGSDAFVPKPQAYFRIDLPEKKYSLFRDSCPFEFEYPANYAAILPDMDKHSEPCWKNIVFSKFGAEVNLSYKPIDGNLEKYLDDSWALATRHQIKASGMPETVIKRDSAKVYGLLFEIEGNAASSLQFYVTDSTQHFLRGALYFFSHPNYDSLAPVIAFIKKDVERIIATLHWKKSTVSHKKK